MRVSKREWYAAGGYANSACYRRANKRGEWRYYIDYEQWDRSNQLKATRAWVERQEKEPTR